MLDINNKLNWKLILGALAIIIIILVPYLIQFHHESLSSTQDNWGYFGSYVGGTLGAIFAFLSFLILYFTLRTQKEELQTAKENYEVQKFESSFYSLLESHNKILNDLNIKGTELIESYKFIPEIGKELSVPDEIFIRFSDKEYERFRGKKNDEIPIETLKYLQENILEDVDLSQYFRVLYQILKFIAKNNVNNKSKVFDIDYINNQENLSEDDEKNYASLVRSFVPVRLLPVLAINCICKRDGYLHNLDKYQSLLERYGFLEHIRLDDLEMNLGSFLILDSYSKALGDKEEQDIESKVSAIQLAYPDYFDNGIYEVGGYLKTYSKPNVVSEV